MAVTGNRVLASAGAEISIAGSAQLFFRSDGSFGFNSPLLPPLDNPVTGGRAIVSGNTLGSQAAGETRAASSGVVVWAGADSVTVDDNLSSGHANVEVDLKGGSDHTVTRNRLGTLGVAGA